MPRTMTTPNGCSSPILMGGLSAVSHTDDDLKELDAILPPETVEALEAFRELTRAAFTGIIDAMLAERTLH